MKTYFVKHFCASCCEVELVEQSHGHIAVLLKGTWVTFHTDFFILEPEIILVQLFGCSSHQDRHRGLGWDHLRGQVQSCCTAQMLLLPSAPRGLALSSLCTFGAHLCLAGFTGVKFLLLLLPTGMHCVTADSGLFYKQHASVTCGGTKYKMARWDDQVVASQWPEQQSSAELCMVGSPSPQITQNYSSSFKIRAYFCS